LEAFESNSSTELLFHYLSITQVDIEAGIVYNLATVVGTSPDTVEVTVHLQILHHVQQLALY
jgi:hypothetical protein